MNETKPILSLEEEAQPHAQTRLGRCTDPGLGELILDYANDLVTGEEQDEIENHLLACAHCQDLFVRLCWLLTIEAFDKGQPAKPQAAASS